MSLAPDLGTNSLYERDRVPEGGVVEGGGLAGLLVHVNVRVVQQAVGDHLVVKHDGDAQGGVLDTVHWNKIFTNINMTIEYFSFPAAFDH